MANTININVLIEAKQELNELIIDDVSPSVFDGILEIYIGTKQMCNDTTIMKTFQKCMEKICEWDDSKVRSVIEMLRKKLNSEDRFLKLQSIVKAVLRINTQIMNNQGTSLDEEMKKVDLIKFDEFIRKVYVEAARRVWSQPYLFYEKGLNSIEVKRNHIIVVGLIRESILSAIRKLLLSRNVFDLIISNTYTVETTNVLQPPVFQESLNKNAVNQTGGDLQGRDEILNIINKNLKVSESDKNTIELNHNAFNNYTPQQNNASDIKSSSTLKKIVNESFEARQNSENNSRHNSTNHNDYHNDYHSSHHHNNQSSRHSTNHSDNHNHSSRRSDRNSSRHSTRYNTATNNISIDTSVKNKIMKDLMTDTVSYKPEDGNEKYQDIFSNSEVPDNTNRKMSKNLNKDKENFYNSYLKK
jgi:hypothetical protein